MGLYPPSPSADTCWLAGQYMLAIQIMMPIIQHLGGMLDMMMMMLPASKDPVKWHIDLSV